MVKSNAGNYLRSFDYEGKSATRERLSMRHFLYSALLLFSIAWSNVSYANNECLDLDPNNMQDFSTSTSDSEDVCIHLKGLNPNTLIQVDKVYNYQTSTQLGYDVAVKVNSGVTIYERNVYAEDDIDLSTLLVGSAIDAKLLLSKAQNGTGYNYTFNVINSYEVEQGLTIISIAVIAEPKSSSPPPPPPLPPPPHGCYDENGVIICMDPLSLDPISMAFEGGEGFDLSSSSSNGASSGGVLIGGVDYSDVGECNDLNRPPTPPPFHKHDSNVQFNLNQVLRTELSWAAKNALQGMGNAANAAYAVSATHLRLFQNHRMGAVYDVKSKGSVWDGEYRFGNFLYGAILAVHGFPENMAHRYAAAYQSWQNYTYSGDGSLIEALGQGIVNFIVNSGDTEGDPELISQGYRYATEVFMENMTDTSSSSCVDSKTIQDALDAEPPSGGGGSGGPSEPPGGSSGTLFWTASCELWRFPNGNGGYYYMNRNCTMTSWMQP